MRGARRDRPSSARAADSPPERSPKSQAALDRAGSGRRRSDSLSRLSNRQLSPAESGLILPAIQASRCSAVTAPIRSTRNLHAAADDRDGDDDKDIDMATAGAGVSTASAVRAEAQAVLSSDVKAGSG